MQINLIPKPETNRTKKSKRIFRETISSIFRNGLMTKALFLSDSYLKESPASVVSVKDDKYVTLDQTIFYAKGGGAV